MVIMKSNGFFIAKFNFFLNQILCLKIKLIFKVYFSEKVKLSVKIDKWISCNSKILIYKVNYLFSNIDFIKFN